MRLCYKDLEVEGKNEKEIDALLERAQKLIGKSQQSHTINKAPVEKIRGAPISFPAGELTIAETAELNGCSRSKIAQKLTSMLKTGEAKIIREEKASGRGKPTKIWKVLHPDQKIPGIIRVIVPKQKKRERNIDLDNPPD